ncbi:MAG: PilZ domain-containing protein [Planctomycetota bacterium]|jgi:hypothetical protein
MLETGPTTFDGADVPAPLKFERRRAPRWPLSGRATACRLGGYEFGRLQDLRLMDYSDGGIGALSDSPLAPGTMISIGFEPDQLGSRRGVVRRCLPCGRGYHVAIQFDRRLAA